MLSLRPASPWRVPVLRTQARAGEGTDAVLAALDRHRDAVRSTARDDDARRLGDVVDIIDEEVHRRLRSAFAAGDDGVGPLLAAVRSGSLDPYAAAVKILADPAALGALLARGTHE